jgi:hypothetical protein
MKSESEIRSILVQLDTNGDKYKGMTYEQGIEAALLWIIQELSDEEFEYSKY